LSSDAEEYIQSHVWPGNVRELKSALLQASALLAKNRPSAATSRSRCSVRWRRLYRVLAHQMSVHASFSYAKL
jgi:DNA-binding NtrC family response regulator